MNTKAAVQNRSVLDLLGVKWAFTQESLLTPDKFEGECNRRGLSVNSAQLEALDRAAVLRPIFEIDASVGGARLRSGSANVQKAVADGRIRSRLAGPKAEWSRASGAAVQMYSYYQLMAVPVLHRFVPKLKVQEPFDSRQPLRWYLDEAKPEWVAIGHGLPLVDEELIVWLSFLEPVFLPGIRQSITFPVPFLTEVPAGSQLPPVEIARLEEQERLDYVEYRRTVPRKDLLHWMRTSPEAVAEKAQWLLTQADFVDPLGDWLHVIRLAPHRWDTLRRDALVALDYRIAAEVLLQLLQDLSEEGEIDKEVYGRTGSITQNHEHHRVTVDYSGREGVLNDFDLSPHPISLVVLEGETEQQIAPLAMDVLGLPSPPWPIRLQNAHGADSNLSWLYRFAWTFEVHEEIPGGFRPSRPLPHIFFVSDPEGRRTDAVQRERDRIKIITKLQEDAEAAARRKLPRDLFEDRVNIEAWSKSFEFSHFSTPELAHAIRLIEPALDGRFETELAKVAASSKPRISSLSYALRQQDMLQHDINKRDLARALWPILEERIKSAKDETELREMPLIATLLNAYEPVRQHPWGHFTYVPAGKPRGLRTSAPGG